MTDQTQPSTRPDPSDEITQRAADSIADLGNGHARASVPGASGHVDPQRRREVVDSVFDDPRINGADHFTVPCLPGRLRPRSGPQPTRRQTHPIGRFHSPRRGPTLS